DLRAPNDATLQALRPLIPVFLSYLLSFVFLGIYWNNHHHLLQAARHVDGRVLWANLHLLFWLSLIPFGAGLMGGTSYARVPVAAYGAVMFLAGLAYYVLPWVLIAHHGRESPLATAVGSDRKGKLSLLIYAMAIVVSFAEPYVACALYV